MKKMKSDNSIKIITAAIGVTAIFANPVAAQIKNYVQAGEYNDSLVKAAKTKNINKVGQLLDAGVPINNTIAANGATPLMQASLDGNVMLVKALLSRGADVNIKDLRDETALKYAIRAGQMDIAQILVENGADTSFLGTQQQPFLRYLSENSQDWSSSYILPGDYKKLYDDMAKVTDFGDKLINAADVGDFPQVKKLIENGHPVNATGKYSTTALMRASYRGHDNIIKYLIEHGANVNQADEAGMTAVSMAQLGGHASTEELLVASGADKVLYAKFEKAAAPLILLAPALTGGISSGTAIAVAGGAIAAVGTGVAIDSNNSGTNPISLQPVNPNTPTPPTLPPTPLPPTPPAMCGGITCAEKNSTGAGVTIAIIGNGVQKTGPYTDTAAHTATYNFIAPNASGVTVWDNNSKDFLTPGIGADDGAIEGAGVMNGHDTETALIINQIAPDAKLLSVRAFNAIGNVIDPLALSQSMKYSVDNGAKVINNSWGIAGLIRNVPQNFDMTYNSAVLWANSTLNTITDENGDPLPAGTGSTIASINYAINNKVVLVWAAGNNGFDNPNISAGLYLIHPEISANADAAKYWLVSTAVADNGDGSYSIAATNSNKCGATQARCLTAVANSTSHSAAQVSGAVAKLIASGLSTEAAANRVLQTATYLDETGHEVANAAAGTTNAITGHGLLNKDLALSPFGSLFVNTGDQYKVLLGGSNIKLGAAFGDAIANSHVSFLAFDNAGNQNADVGSAPFPISLSSLVDNKAKSLDLDDAMLRFGDRNFAENIVYENGGLQFTPYQTSSEIHSPEQKANTNGNFAYSSNIGSANYLVSHNVGMDKAFGFGAIAAGDINTGIGSTVNSNPYLGFADDGLNIISGYNINKNFAVKWGAFNGKEVDQYTNIFSNEKAVSGSVGEVVYGFGSTKIGMQAGTLSEKGAFLGSESNGIFASSGGTPTKFYSVSASSSIAPNVNLHGYYAQGTSSPSADSGSLFAGGISDITSNAYSLGVSFDGFEDQSTSIGFSATQPLRIKQGTASFVYDKGLDASGNIVKDTAQVNLQPSGRELDLETYYHKNINPTTSTTISSMYRINPDHVANADDEGILLFKLLNKF